MKDAKKQGKPLDRDEWRTPRDIFDPLDRQYHFFLDCCASPENALCPSFTSRFENHLSSDVMCWMNPPFSKAVHMFTHFCLSVRHGVALYRCDNMETMIWQAIIFPRADWVFIPEFRVAYQGIPNKWNRPVFASALIGIGVPPPLNLQGSLLFPKGGRP